MKSNTFIQIALLLVITINSFPQSKDLLVIDTDAGTDDYRAIILITQLKQYDLKAITLSDGTLFPDKGAWRVETLLKCLGIEHIQIGVGKKTMYNKPFWRKYAENVPWSSCYTSPVSNKSYPLAKNILTSVLEDAKNKSVTIACLGSMSNLYETLKENQHLINKIKQIIWYNSSDINYGTNYIFEPKAANFILEKNISIYIVNAIKHKKNFYSDNFVKSIRSLNTKHANEIYYQLKYFYDLNDTTHLKCWDELCALYLANPNLFTLKENVKEPRLKFISDYEVEKLQKLYLELLAGTYRPQKHVIFSIFPTDSIFFPDDINEIKDEIIKKYGYKEFMLGTLTSEIHNHLGIYSIVGMKMGLYACEILNASKNQIKITSYTGNTLPLSCMNDGIMVATGSTPAYNLLTISDSIAEPSAKFCFKQKCIKLTLKKDIYLSIQNEIQDAVYKYTISSSEYWKTIRKLALHYWLILDRNSVFELEHQ
jgi:pyrimidine-specific ribonucleoside hydrolase